MIGTITFNPSIDQLITVPGLHKDDTNRATSVVHYPGGKGVNVSKVVRELGGPTHAFALTGGFTGQFWGKLVKDLDIPHTVLSVKEETRVNTILTDLKDRTQTRISAPGPRIPARIVRKFLKRLLQARPKPFLWAFGGSLSHRMDPSTYCHFVRVLQSNGTPCVLDTDGEALKRGIQAKPFMIKPNEYEIRRLVGRRMSSIKDYLAAARTLVRSGVKLVIVSLASKGALFVNEREAFHVLGIDVPVKSKVGAGDSLIAGVSLGLLRGKSLRESASLGIAASTSAVMREAPRLCLHKDIRPLLRRVAISSL